MDRSALCSEDTPLWQERTECDVSGGTTHRRFVEQAAAVFAYEGNALAAPHPTDMEALRAVGSTPLF